MPELKQLALRIFHETLQAIDIPAVMQRKLHREGTSLFLEEKRFDLRSYARIRVVAMGKAAHAMTEGLAALLGSENAFEGIVSAPTAARKPIAGVKYFTAGHPVPNAESWKAAEEMLAMLKQCDERTLVFFLLSGGASSLVELPLDSRMPLEDVQALYKTLVTCGATIEEINTVRKHVSAIKGGRLAAAAWRATKISLAVTDVPTGKESALASGPTLPDPSTVADVERIIVAYSLREKLPERLRQMLVEKKLLETPKPQDPAFANAHFLLLLGMDDLFHPAHKAAEAAGFITHCDNATDECPVEKAAEYLLEQLHEFRRLIPGKRVALIADGEVISPVTGDGIGGRNSAFVLACVERIAGRGIAVLSAGTDGIDGNSPAAGAVADGVTLVRAQEIGIDPTDAFHRSDAFSFFAKLGDAIVTGQTGSNLRDLRVLLAEPE